MNQKALINFATRTGVTMGLMQLLDRVAKDKTGGTAIEYGLIASLVVIASIGAFDAVANENTGLWATISSKVGDNMGN
ncbi:Flp family type IVb pilin [Pontixanthobacter luteolus]|nr:Flp family type IVb pilin [Pontixanthobacter luteolus]